MIMMKDYLQQAVVVEIQQQPWVLYNIKICEKFPNNKSYYTFLVNYIQLKLIS